ncbi:hypothetical protein IJT10_04915 [bacterium]|nr:hypothetical protein [bacterium]
MAEREAEVLYEESYLDSKYRIEEAKERELNYKINKTNSIVNNYTERMKVAEKLDNDIRYLIAQSNKCKDLELANFVDKRIMPISTELLSVASKVTSESQAINDTHKIFIEYVVNRHKAMAILATYANKTDPEVTESSESSYRSDASASGFGVQVSASDSGYSKYSYYRAESKSDDSYEYSALMRSAIGEAEKLRHEYYRSLEYIKSNSVEIIGKELDGEKGVYIVNIVNVKTPEDIFSVEE